MALQWLVLAYVVIAEAALAFILTLPSPKPLRNRLVSLVSLGLQPAFSIIPFCVFLLLDIHWKKEHSLICTSEICTPSERLRYEKSVYKAQRNVIMCFAAIFLYWCIFRICKYCKELQKLEEVEKRYKAQ